jgi:energy-coupling factor transporter ATP-binding protein EcfA2
MKYGELIQFDPIETVIQIRDANDAGKAAKLIQSYVMSDDMAEMINQKILSELKLDEVIDNKGVLLVGNYGTGKSHLMSVISGVAEDKDNLQYLRNKAFAGYMEPLAGRFEVLRIEIGAVRTYLRDIILGELEKDLARRGINYKFPSADKITGNKDALNEMMLLFEQKYGQKGYLLVIDELLDYLKSRTEMDLMLELGFLRELGEFIKNSRFRVICGVQEALFDNPSFTFVANTLLKVKDRFEQAIIRREDIAYVVSERILKKNPEQKAKIREHLIKFCPLYQNMNERLEEFVELFPIHPAYIETFQRVYLAEKREVLKTISATVKSIVKEEVPKDQPGVKSYDTYWKYIKENMAKKVEPEIKEVLEKSSVLEDIINRSFTKPAYKPLALQAIYALSVHRLTTGSLDVKAGLTAQNLKDDLLLFIDTPVKEEEFLLTTVQTVMRAIIETVSGQFIEYNKDNEQYYLDLTKIIDYDAKIEQKANVLHESQLNTYFYALIYDLLDWESAELFTGHKIYEYFLNWDEKNIFRQGYLFMGESNERPTAQPPRDFYVYFLPPYGLW